MGDPMKMNTGVLAYLGDAVYELYIRKYLADTGQIHTDRLHAAAVNFVRAGAQAAVCRKLVDELPEDEQSLVRRARNRRIGAGTKSAGPMDYKWATAFEALIGYYYLSERTEDMEELILKAINLIGADMRKGANGK
ncbi:MAG: ribonuclease III [Clostridiales Family XIII bacterium]|jgi:ribonuclease-3 family protein|nr:ribonuclease III [Clostridiales Family XIII bacterium]